MKLMRYLLDCNYMLMFSDFAVEALINDWDSHILQASNPFVTLGQCDSSLELSFIPGVLKECESIQLQLVGQLNEKGSMNIHCLSNTIVFGLKNPEILNLPEYDINLLTVCTKFDGHELNVFKNCEIGSKKGSIGHVMLKFKNGGNMLLSSGHWIEMTKFEVDVDNLEKVAEDFGGQYMD